MTKERPIAVTLLGWYLAVLGECRLVSLLIYAPTERYRQGWEAVDVSPTLVIAWSATQSIMNVIVGVGILRGYGWLRWLYLLSYLLSNLMSVWNCGPSILLVPSSLARAVFGLAVFVLLFMPQNSAFFGATVENEQQPDGGTE